MERTHVLRVLAVVVIAGLLTTAVVQDVASRKGLSGQVLKVDDQAHTSTWFVVPEPLFDEKTNAKLKPLLGLMSGAFAVHYQGPQSTFAVSVDYWSEGDLKNTASGMSVMMLEKDKDAEGNYHFEGDFVYALKDHTESNGNVFSELEYAIIDQKGSYSTVVRIDKPQELKATGVLKLQQRTKASLGDSIVIGGLQGTNRQSMMTYSTIAETLQHAEWAMTIRLAFTEK